MTGGAILSEPAVVFVILPMARETILRRRLQIRNGARIEMTFRARQSGVFTIEFENKSGVGEVIAEFIHAVMTGKAIRSKRQDMCLGEDNIHLTVTTVAGLRGEGFDILTMTIFATERFTHRCQPVPFQ